MTGTLPALAPDLRAVLERHADRLDLELVDRALRFSASAHRGQKRMSGEDFVSHTIAVALILAEQLLDSTTIAGALLHDVVEDTLADPKTIRGGRNEARLPSVVSRETRGSDGWRTSSRLALLDATWFRQVPSTS